jgi:hypothetical protein
LYQKKAEHEKKYNSRGDLLESELKRCYAAENASSGTGVTAPEADLFKISLKSPA